MKAIKNIMIYDYEKFYKNGYIIFDDEITSVGCMDDFDFDGETIDGEGKLLLPGLINSHTHIYSTLFRGLNLNASPHDFKGVLEEIWWRFDKELDLESIKLSAQVYSNESLLAGVTALIDHHASGEIKTSLSVLSNAISEAGLKHILCFETSDRFNTKESFLENEYALNNNGYFGLHASMSLSDDTLNSLKGVLGDNPIHIHVAESMIDQADSLKKYDKRVIRRLDDIGILNEDSILAHCIHITKDEAKTIKHRKCVVALNPTSNMNNAVGIFNIMLFENNQIQVIVGTDGLGVNVAKEWQNLYYNGKQSTSNPSGLSLDFVKKSLINSYKYFNRRNKCKVGLIKKWYDSDFILVDYTAPTPITDDNVFAHVFFSVFDGLKAHSVYTNGKLRVENYKIVSDYKYDLDVVDRLWSKFGGAQ